ncbi:MAG: N-acetylmuramoyl-L-alanine amidase, partial [Oscillospiraceae bacterium]|nr:N-acetylmuramoyl-L-alanine amidase [Oscillospiraceae bacterium]
RNKGYLLKFYIFTSMYIIAALFILYLTFRANANSQDLRNLHHRVSAETAVARIKPAVIIDAGHGGADGGAVGINGEIEKDINLAIALKLRRLFIMSNFQVILTRDADILLSTDGVRKKKASDLTNRAKIANNNPRAIFLSIHMNKFPQEKYSGLQVFFAPDNLDSANLADLIRMNNREYLQPDNNREIKKGRDMFVLENIKNVGVLIECGFLSNKEEAALLASEDYQNKLARIIFASVAEFERTFND